MACNRKHWLAFNRRWFENHQGELLYLGKQAWFRRLMGIEGDGQLVSIAPDSYIIDRADDFQATFYSGHAMSRALYKRFCPLWWGMHAWDWAVADRFQLMRHLSFNFSTLTAYPDPDPEVTTVDGRIVSNHATGILWATLRSGTGTGVTLTASPSVTSGAAPWVQGSTSNKDWGTNIGRGFCLFDCSPLSVEFTCTAASLRWSNGAGTDGIGNCLINVFESTPASDTNLTTADWAAFVMTTSFCASSKKINDYINPFDFNSNGIAFIKDGIVRLGMLEVTHDVGNTAFNFATGSQGFTTPAFAEGGNTSTMPQLKVTYTLPGTSFKPIPMRPRPFAPGIAR
jgi:hypothetical protein